MLSPLIPWLISLVMTLVAYSPSLSAGFMYDDPLDLPRATDRTPLEILTSPGIYSYFRPLPLLIWNLLHSVLGRNDPVLLHSISLGCHAIAGWLVYQLGARLIGRSAGLVAAAIFLWYPPSYQAVGFVNGAFNLLATVGILAAAVLYWDARTLSSGPRLVLALACGALGLASYESGVTILPIVVGVEMVLFLRGGTPRPALLPPLLFAAEIALYGVVWLLMPKFPSNSDLGLGSLASNGLFFLQGLTTPISSFLGYLPGLGESPSATLVVAGGATVAVLLLILAARQRLLVGSLGLIWFGAAVTPPWLLLPWEAYVANAPRLLYLPSVGMALFWAAALAPILSSGFRALQRVAPIRVVSTSVAIVAVAFVLLSSFRFIAMRERAQTQGAEIVTQVLKTATRSGPDAHATYVNLPAFLTPRDSGFLFGHWGITTIPEYVYELGLVVRVAEGFKPPLSSVAYTVIEQDWEHFYGNQGPGLDLERLQGHFRAGGPVYVTRYEPGHLRLEHVGQLNMDAPAPVSSTARFADWAALEDAWATTAGQRVILHLVWHALAGAPGDYTVFAHALDASGALIGQADAYPLGAMFPPSAWKAGDRAEDNREVQLSSGATPAVVLVGFYDRANPAARAIATDAFGNRLSDEALAVRVTRS